MMCAEVFFAVIEGPKLLIWMIWAAPDFLVRKSLVIDPILTHVVQLIRVATVLICTHIGTHVMYNMCPILFVSCQLNSFNPLGDCDIKGTGSEEALTCFGGVIIF